MTIIVGCTNGEKAFIGCDTLAVDGASIAKVSTPKFAVADHGTAIGWAGNARASQIVWRHIDSCPHVRDLITAMDAAEWVKDLLVRHGAIERADQEMPDHRGWALIVSDRQVFTMDCFYAVNQQDAFGAIGCGYEPALGAMWAAYQIVDGVADPEAVASFGVEAAMWFNVFCGGDIITQEVP